MEVDFTDQIKECKAYRDDDNVNHKPLQQHDVNCPQCGCGLGKMYMKYGAVMPTNLILPDRMPYASNMFAAYPGENVKRNKDGVPAKKAKKRACKPGEYRDKNGELKKTKGGEEAITPSQPKTKGLENPRNQHEYDVDRNVDGGEEVDLSQYQPKTKGLENPRNMNEYYKSLYKKVKGLD